MEKTVCLNAKFRVVDFPTYEDVVWSVKRAKGFYLGIVESFFSEEIIY